MAQQQSDVVVIGGGFAGLAAGREAARLGCDVTLVEASDRLGGRTWTTDGLGTRVELGGTDVHWLQPNAWTEVARYGLEIEEFAPPERVLYLHDGAIHEGTVEEVGAQMEKAMTALSTLAREVLPRPQDAGWEPKILEYDGLTLGAFLDELALHPLERDITTSFWSAACQAPLDEVGVVLALRWLALAGWDWEVMLDVISRYKIVGGMGQLSAAIAAETEAAFAMNTRVAEVRSNGRGVEVVPETGDPIAARAVVCAVPLNVLDDIRFDPGLPDALAELAAEGQLSRGLKVVCRIKGDRAPYMCLAPEGAPFVWMQYDRPLDGDHIAVAFGADASGVDGSIARGGSDRSSRVAPGHRGGRCRVPRLDHGRAFQGHLGGSSTGPAGAPARRDRRSARAHVLRRRRPCARRLRPDRRRPCDRSPSGAERRRLLGWPEVTAGLSRRRLHSAPGTASVMLIVEGVPWAGWAGRAADRSAYRGLVEDVRRDSGVGGCVV